MDEHRMPRRRLAPLALLVGVVGLTAAWLAAPDALTRQVSDVSPSAPHGRVAEVGSGPSPSPTPSATPGLPAGTRAPTAGSTGGVPAVDEESAGVTPTTAGTPRRLAMRASLRSRPEQGSERIMLLPAGFEVMATGRIRHGWCEVRAEGRTGWIAGYALHPVRR